jgi:hypothetical protein
MPAAAGAAAGQAMEELILPVGGRRILTLPGLGSAGYQWFGTVEDEAVASLERLGTVPRHAPGPQGSRDEQFEIHALAQGQTILRFAQRRIFEPGRPPHAERPYLLRVT